ncbi:hypothetical protein HK405_012331, partial [Cladochytrium tenue]
MRPPRLAGAAGAAAAFFTFCHAAIVAAAQVTTSAGATTTTSSTSTSTTDATNDTTGGDTTVTATTGSDALDVAFYGLALSVGVALACVTAVRLAVRGGRFFDRLCVLACLSFTVTQAASLVYARVSGLNPGVRYVLMYVPINLGFAAVYHLYHARLEVFFASPRAARAFGLAMYSLLAVYGGVTAALAAVFYVNAAATPTGGYTVANGPGCYALKVSSYIVDMVIGALILAATMVALRRIIADNEARLAALHAPPSPPLSAATPSPPTPTPPVQPDDPSAAAYPPAPPPAATVTVPAQSTAEFYRILMASDITKFVFVVAIEVYKAATSFDPANEFGALPASNNAFQHVLDATKMAIMVGNLLLPSGVAKIVGRGGGTAVGGLHRSASSSGGGTAATTTASSRRGSTAAKPGTAEKPREISVNVPAAGGTPGSPTWSTATPGSPRSRAEGGPLASPRSATGWSSAAGWAPAPPADTTDSSGGGGNGGGLGVVVSDGAALRASEAATTTRWQQLQQQPHQQHQQPLSHRRASSGARDNDAWSVNSGTGLLSAAATSTTTSGGGAVRWTSGNGGVVNEPPPWLSGWPPAPPPTELPPTVPERPAAAAGPAGRRRSLAVVAETGGVLPVGAGSVASVQRQAVVGGVANGRRGEVTWATAAAPRYEVLPPPVHVAQWEHGWRPLQPQLPRHSPPSPLQPTAPWQQWHATAGGGGDTNLRQVPTNPGLPSALVAAGDRMLATGPALQRANSTSAS